MDPLTHGLLGAACAQAVCGRSPGRRALAWGALAGMAPDVDVVMNLTGPMAEWTWHRGLTHALWLPPLAGAVLGGWLWRRYGGRRRQWVVLVALAMLSHPLLDAFTTYGTQLLAPFSRQRFAWNGVAIVDPAYTLVLALALVIGWVAGTGSRGARLAATAALALTTTYLALGVWLNADVEREARAQLEAEGVRVERVAAYPTLLQLPLRRVVVRGEGGTVRVGWVSALAPRPISWEVFMEARGPLVDTARASREARLFEWFAMGEVGARVVPTSDGAAVELDDLRYGVPGHPRDGLWGLRVRLDAGGRVQGGERIDRPLPRGRTLLRELWRRTIGTG